MGVEVGGKVRQAEKEDICLNGKWEDGGAPEDPWLLGSTARL